MPGIGKTRIFHSLKQIALEILKEKDNLDYHPIEIFISFENGASVCSFDTAETPFTSSMKPQDVMLSVISKKNKYN
jgi:hypothetical protein